MDWAATVLSLAASAGLAAFAGWRGARPPDLVRGPRLVPWRLIMVMAAVAALFTLVHIANLLGVETGRR